MRGELQIQILEVAYEYAFFRRDDFEIAGTFGLHNLGITTQLSGTASGTGGDVIDLRRQAKHEGPLPVVGFRGIWAFSDRFYADAQAQFFAASIDEYDGTLSDYKISVVWHPVRNGRRHRLQRLYDQARYRRKQLQGHAAVRVRGTAGLHQRRVLKTNPSFRKGSLPAPAGCR